MALNVPFPRISFLACCTLFEFSCLLISSYYFKYHPFADIFQSHSFLPPLSCML